jgi:hypothetical protein
MERNQELKTIIEGFKQNPPKIIGGYKKQGWAVKVLEKIENENIEQEEDGTITAKAIVEASDETYYPTFLTIDIKSGGQIIGAYFISEKSDQFELIPFEIAKEFMNKEEKELLPFKYKSLEKIDGDNQQKNWPEFS